VPSVRLLTLMPVTDQLPPEPTVVVCAAVVWIPSVATTEMVAPTVPVPLAEVLVILVPLIGLVTLVIETLGAVIVFFVVVAVMEVLADESVAVAV
jgi:hypothetical protein